MTILEETSSFEKENARTLISGGRVWKYYRLGRGGSPVLWLTGGLRRAALGYAFLMKLAERHVVIAPDYPPVSKAGAFTQALDGILETEKIEQVILAGQSYGSMLAQAYLADRPEHVKMLVISSGGPADYKPILQIVDYLAIGLVYLLPGRSAQRMFFKSLQTVLPSSTGEQKEWLEVVRQVVTREFTRADLVSHFAVAADIIRTRRVRPEVFQHWQGRVIVLSATNDPTQSTGDSSHYEHLFGRPVEMVDLGDMGHAGSLYNPEKFLAYLEPVLAA
jgi:pimeloyl-ACP methyl ester carboxylesterase